MSEIALAPSQSSALDVYGAGQDIRQLAERIKMCLPNGEKLQVAEAMALAQLAVAYTLNPFNGEVWYIPGKGTMVGIKGLRKAARRQSEYWPEFVLLSSEERQAVGVPDGAIAYKCLIYRTDMIQQSAKAIKMMYDAGMKDAADRYGYKPTAGYGYWTRGESTKMKPDQAARKRAEADALKVAFDLPFATDVGNGNRIGFVDDLEAMDTATVEGEYRVAPDPERVAETSRILYGDPEFEGLGDEPQEPAPEPEQEPEPEPDGKMTAIQHIRNVAELLMALNLATNHHYKSAQHMHNAAKEVHGDQRWAFPKTGDVAAFADVYAILVDHAAANRQK